jgi:glycosyltransferase involved in cell wall biosynthesis
MIGDGPERIKAEELTRELGIESNVKFLGKLRVIESMLAISDVFILPSETESFGLVALEAMASRTAIISTNSGGLPEVNIEGKTGYLSDVGDIDKMANDTISLLSDIDMLNRFKMNALAHANSYALCNIVPRYKEIYEKLCCRIEDK